MNEYSNIINRNGRVPSDYIGIMFNGDMGVYRKSTIKALKKRNVEKTVIKAVRAADGDLAISKILIKEDLFDVLVDIFNVTDARTAVLDYIETLDDQVADECKAELNGIKGEIANAASQVDKNSDYAAAVVKFDKKINEICDAAHEKLKSIHSSTAKEVYSKYHDACERKLKALKKQIKDMEEESKKLNAIIKRIN